MDRLANKTLSVTLLTWIEEVKNHLWNGVLCQKHGFKWSNVVMGISSEFRHTNVDAASNSNI